MAGSPLPGYTQETMRHTLRVSPSGEGDYRTLGEAIRAAETWAGEAASGAVLGAASRASSDAAPNAGTGANRLQRIRISLGPGVYREKLKIALPGLELVGAGRDETSIVWDDSARKPLPGGEPMGTFNSYTLYVGAPGVRLRGLAVENAAGDGRIVGQAVALYADADDFLAEDCRFSARQDTLCTGPLPKNPPPKGTTNLVHPVAGLGEDQPALPFRQLYRRCLIEGDVDFIFGSALAVFQDCEIRSLARLPLESGGATGSGAGAPASAAAAARDGAAPPDPDSGAQGWIAAPSTYPGQNHGFVFLDCRLRPGSGAAEVYLGRPWRHTGRAVFIRCSMGPHILPQGWDDWGKPEARAYGGFGEYGSRGPGAPARGAPEAGTQGRASWARKIDPGEAEVLTPERLLGADFGL